jgi:transcriptional regulator with XRE-family HTH domain
VTDRRVQEGIDPMLWRRADMRAALAARDIAAVFKLLQRVGVSQRRIAALTGQSQSEISEILSGRHVVSYDVLARIADGLGVPRGHLGLAYDDATAALVGLAPTDPATGEPQGEQPADAMTRLTELTVGTATVDPRTWTQPFPVQWGPVPDHIGQSDVARVQAMTDQLRNVDRQHGGGACREPILGQISWVQQLLRARATAETSRALHQAIADQHLLAGWAAFDVGVLGPARRHFARALEHARFIDDSCLVAVVLYRLGRLHLHHGWATQALRLFQLGQVAAQESGVGRAVAMQHANLAWAHAAAGDGRQALACVGRARDEYGRSETEEIPPWISHFDSAELQALRGMALATIPDPGPAHRAEAIERFSVSTALRELPFARPRAFELTALAWLLIDSGEVDHGIKVGHEAVDVAVQIRSQRVIDRMAPLRAVLARRRAHGDARDLAERIAGLHRQGPGAPPPVPVGAGAGAGRDR